MGEEFLVVYGWVQRPAEGAPPLNFEAARAAVETLDLAELHSFYEYADGLDFGEEPDEEGPTADDARKFLNRHLDELAEVLDLGYGFAWVDSPDKQHRLFVTGGSSYGEPPSRLYTVFSDLMMASTVATALGFLGP